MFSDHMECCAALVVARVACDQRFAFSENTTGTIWCAFQRELADWRLTLPHVNRNKKLLNEADYLDVRLDMDSIEQVGELKYLGVWLDSSLKFTSHISKMSSKISSAIGVISRISRYLPVVQRKMLYNAMVLPYFNYCSITWSTADQNHLNILERLQKRAGRMVLGVPSRTSTREVYDKLKWTNLRNR